MSWPSGGGGDASYNRVPQSEGGDSNDNDPFLREHMSQLRQQKKEQDDNLSMLGDSVTRLGQLSLSISKEIDSQNEMLDDLSEDIDTATDTADMLTKKTEDLVKQVGGPKQFCTILILCAILFILTLLVVYT